MKKQRLVGMALLCGAFVLVGCKHEHVWEEATCEMPKHCTECEATEGEVLKHTWKAANCTVAKTCKVCGTTEGEALGHSFMAATCVSAEGCIVCGEKRGEPVAHTGEIIGTCKLCGETYNKDLVLKMGYRHEVAANDFVTAMNRVVQGAVEMTQDMNVLTEIDAETDPETVFIGEYPIMTITMGQYLEWADGLIRKLYWEDRMEDYAELKAVYEEVYFMCADYQELSALKNQTKKIIDLIPITVPAKEEMTGGIYDVLLIEMDSELEEQWKEAFEQWMADMKEDLTWLVDIDTEMKAWQEEYDKVNALFK